MYLYHGTSWARLQQILKGGEIKPRGVTGRSCWKHSIESNPDTVYLTSAYPLYFAFNAAKDGADGAIIEVDTNRMSHKLFVADEDAIEQSMRGKDNIHSDMKTRTRWYRENIRANPLFGPNESLNSLGTVGYQGSINEFAITAYARLSDKTMVQLIVAGVDPYISLANYGLKGRFYRWATAKMMQRVPLKDDEPRTVEWPREDGNIETREEWSATALDKIHGMRLWRENGNGLLTKSFDEVVAK